MNVISIECRRSRGGKVAKKLETPRAARRRLHCLWLKDQEGGKLHCVWVKDETEPAQNWHAVA
jgi:hypothetical protein